MKMSSVEINSVLAQMRALESSIDMGVGQESQSIGRADFSQVLHNSLTAVSETQNKLLSAYKEVMNMTV